MKVLLARKHALVFDAFVFSTQLSDLYELAVAFPGTTIVITTKEHQLQPLETMRRLHHIMETIRNHGEVERGDGQNCQRLPKRKKVGGFVPQLGHSFDKREKPITSEELALG